LIFVRVACVTETTSMTARRHRKRNDWIMSEALV
jgi:hypothetical protein